jgi:hypothetical protein
MPGNQLKKIPCCPTLTQDDTCDVLKLDYRLTHMAGDIPVEVTYRLSVSRCTEGLALGDLLYTTTLLPGEKVRLASHDRTSRFTLDTESNVASFAEFSSEEQAFLSTFSKRATEYDTERYAHSESDSESEVTGSGRVSGPIQTLIEGGSASATGTYDGHSTHDFLEQLRGHLESTHAASVEASKARQSRAISEVAKRSHVEGESETHSEAASRTFENRNQGHAVTYLFYQMVKLQKVSIEVESISRRVMDPAGDTRVGVAPRRRRVTEGVEDLTIARPGIRATPVITALRPIAVDQRVAAIKQVDDDLVASKIAVRDSATKGLKPSGQLTEQMHFEHRSALPTPGIIVRACLDECDSSEPLRREMLEADLEQKKLANQLLKKQIELLERHADYRCCPEHQEPVEP